MNIIMVAAGGAIGASCRYLLSLLFTQQSFARFPTSTFLANSLGCLAIGVLFAWLNSSASPSHALKLFLLTGVLGGFTTFSSFSLEALELWQQQRFLLAGGYVLGTLMICLAAVTVGYYLMSLLGKMG